MAPSDQNHAEWDTLMAAGKACIKTGKYEEAAKNFEAALKLAKNFGLADVDLGRALFHLGKARAKGWFMDADAPY